MKTSEILRIGDKIRELRENKKWTQKQLAEASQINEVQIRRYENNQAFPREEQLIKIANSLGVCKNYFIEETDSSNSKDIKKVLYDILKRGNNAEVRQDKDGKMIVYEIEKKKRYIDGV